HMPTRRRCAAAAGGDVAGGKAGGVPREDGDRLVGYRGGRAATPRRVRPGREVRRRAAGTRGAAGTAPAQVDTPGLERWPRPGAGPEPAVPARRRIRGGAG